MSVETSFLVDGLVGALIGGAATLGGVLYTQRDQAKQARLDEAAQVEAVLQAIDVELTVLLERYQEAIGNQLEESTPSEAFWYTFPVYNDYFTVYHTNAGLIGRIPDEELRLVTNDFCIVA